jgi:hypothetical protein
VPIKRYLSYFAAYRYLAGIKELDEELAMEENEEDFNPDDNTKDYEKVAKSLPVFCVSSRAYQQMKGRLKKDSPVAGFQTLEETEIPQLQEHCKALTVAGRTATCKQFMNKLSALLNSLAIWASNDGTGNNLSADQRAREDRFLKNSLEKLDRVSGLQSQYALRVQPYDVMIMFHAM